MKQEKEKRFESKRREKVFAGSHTGCVFSLLYDCVFNTVRNMLPAQSQSSSDMFLFPLLAGPMMMMIVALVGRWSFVFAMTWAPSSLSLYYSTLLSGSDFGSRQVIYCCRLCSLPLQQQQQQQHRPSLCWYCSTFEFLLVVMAKLLVTLRCHLHYIKRVNKKTKETKEKKGKMKRRKVVVVTSFGSYSRCSWLGR